MFQFPRIHLEPRQCGAGTSKTQSHGAHVGVISNDHAADCRSREQRQRLLKPEFRHQAEQAASDSNGYDVPIPTNHSDKCGDAEQ